MIMIMKYCLGRLQRHRQHMPMDLGADDQEANYFKGSLVDRVTSLEYRLCQLCLEMQSSSISCSSSSLATTQTLVDMILLQPKDSRENRLAHSQHSHPWPRSEPHLLSHVCLSSRPEIQEKPDHGVPKKSKHANPDPKRRLGNRLADKDDDQKKCKSRKKLGFSPNLPHLKILGC